MEKHRRSCRSRKKVRYSNFSDSSDDDFKEKDASVAKKQKGETTRTNKKKQERKTEKDTANDLPSRPLGSEDLHKDLTVAMEHDEEDRKSENESECIINNEVNNKVCPVKEQKKNACKLLNREFRQENESQVDTEDVEYVVNSEEDESADGKEDWKESNDESDDGNSKSRKPEAKTKKGKEACLNRSKSSDRQMKKQSNKTHSISKTKIINYCAKQPLNLPAVKLRLGLSRKASIKPLHPAVKVQQ